MVIRGAKRKKAHRAKFTLDDVELSILSLPTVLWYLAFCYLPMFGVVIAFKNYKVKPGAGFLYSLFVNSKWVGFKNFEYLIKGRDAFIMFRNTILYNIVFIVLGIVIPVTLAVLITQLYSRRIAKVCQTSMFMPYFLSWVVVSYFLYAFLSTDKGLINRLAAMTGAENPWYSWYQAEWVWPFILVFLQMWKTVGYNMVVYLAAISGIDAELYEAALIDGAGKLQQVLYITLPLLRPIISIMFILSVGNIFRTDFGLFYQATRNSSAILDVTRTIDVYVFQCLIDKPNITLASAAAFVQSVFGMVTIIVANIVVKRIDPDAGLF